MKINKVLVLENKLRELEVIIHDLRNLVMKQNHNIAAIMLAIGMSGGQEH